MSPRAARTYLPWIIGLAVWWALNHVLYMAAIQQEMSTFRGDPLTLTAVTHSVLGAYLGLGIGIIARHTDPKRWDAWIQTHRYFYRSVVPLAALGLYPVVAISTGWRIPLPMMYVALTPDLWIAAGIVAVLGVMSARRHAQPRLCSEGPG